VCPCTFPLLPVPFPPPPSPLLRGLLELWYQKQNPSVLHWTCSFACICICSLSGSVIYALRGQHANRYVKVSPYFIGLESNDMWGAGWMHVWGFMFLMNPVCLPSQQDSKLKTLQGLQGDWKVGRLWLWFKASVIKSLYSTVLLSSKKNYNAVIRWPD